MCLQQILRRHSILYEERGIYNMDKQDYSSKRQWILHYIFCRADIHCNRSWRCFTCVVSFFDHTSRSTDPSQQFLERTVLLRTFTKEYSPLRLALPQISKHSHTKQFLLELQERILFYQFPLGLIHQHQENGSCCRKEKSPHLGVEDGGNQDA